MQVQVLCVETNMNGTMCDEIYAVATAYKKNGRGRRGEQMMLRGVRNLEYKLLRSICTPTTSEENIARTVLAMETLRKFCSAYKSHLRARGSFAKKRRE